MGLAGNDRRYPTIFDLSDPRGRMRAHENLRGKLATFFNPKEIRIVDTTMSENQIITNRHYYAHFSLFLCAPQNSADPIAIHE
jgi:hypothetical protein